MKSFNTNGISRRWLGLGMSLVAALAVQAQTAVTFQINMVSETVTPVTNVTIAGSFNGWSYQNPAWSLINVSGTIWSNTFTISDPVGTVESCKFNDNTTGWEPLAANRQFVLAAGTQVLPLTEWSTNDWPAPTNSVTFQVDMSAQILTHAFTNGVGGNPAAGNSITVSGDFEGWNNGLPLTNNPSLPGLASNIYSAPCPVVGYPGGTTINYKFRMNGGWESPASTGGGNRTAAITNTTQVLPLVFYNDASVSDLVQNPITVNFTLYMPNGTVDNAAYAFQKGIDTLWINGDWLGWWGWNPLGTGGQAGSQMVEVGSSDYYTNSFVIPPGQNLNLTYKYSIDGADNENGFSTNHVRYIRSYPPSYTMPTDSWSFTVCPPGTPYPNPGITATNIVEPSFGYLNVGAPSGVTVPVTWLGRPGVELVNRSSLSTGTWNPLPGTDGTQSTNWPNAGAGDTQFFRLLKK